MNEAASALRSASAVAGPDFSRLLAGHGRVQIGGAPQGVDAVVVARAARQGGRAILVVARNDVALNRLAQNLGFIDPALEVITVPAWDCLPYDRVSPHADVVAARMDALCKLAADRDDGEGPSPRIIVTTVNAALQRVPPRAVLRRASLQLAVGEAIGQDALFAYLSANGYHRTGTVREPGEYAVRGGLIDLFPTGSETPVRLDFFGDELEAIRRFDAGTQRSLGALDTVMLRPVSEAVLTEESIARFRSRYREAFGVAVDHDPLYASISEGRRHPGFEHWLPFFHDGLETIFDYAGEAAVIVDHDIDEAVEARLEAIEDYYKARLDLLPAAMKAGSGDIDTAYRPAPKEEMFLSAAEWSDRLEVRPLLSLSPFALPDSDADRSLATDMGGRAVLDFAAVRADPNKELFREVSARLASIAGRRILIAAYSQGARDRLKSLFAEHSLADLQPVDSLTALEALPPGAAATAVLDLENGFTLPGLTVWTEQDILGQRLSRPPRRNRRAEEFISEVASLEMGDLVVHVDHGIGRYDGLETLTVDRAPHDCLRVLYAGDDKLYVPVENIEVLSRFGSEDAGVSLDRLGGAAWQARKAKIKERVREMAGALLKVAAERALKRGEVVTPGEGAFDEFVARFGFAETDDQQRAIGDVIEDLGSGKPMDRLICGDVGFGKTEIALRAAFIAAMHGLQVAVVVPTTLLARQHLQVFSERFKGLPVRIAQLSRLVSGKDATAVKAELAEGKIDIVIGTHALLSKSIRFRDLGLLIVDEEQHFGVAQKERLKQLRANVHVLTLTATPIPRTLQMALSGVREMSIIATPPVDRLAVRTFVTPYDPVVVKEAIQRERYRGGQVFYVCPRVADLGRVADRLKKLLPDLKMATAHGQMGAAELESVMSDFVDGKHELLLSTNIVESGLDIPSANTMIIHRADMFGLAQLYQLRGRIGRSKLRGYCYLTLPPGRILTPSAQKRLEVMQTLDSLGAGFTLASHDLDIRGAGNLLGEEQSGHIREVGVELYQRMLEEAVAEARGGVGESAAETWSPVINIGAAVLIPESYAPDLPVRLGLYRRLSGLKTRAELDAFAVELVDRFGPLPEAVENLLKVVEIKQLCRKAGVDKIEAGPKGAVVSFHNNSFANPQGLVGFIQKQAGSAKLRPDHKLVLMRPWEAADRRLKGVARLVSELAQVAE